MYNSNATQKNQADFLFSLGFNLLPVNDKIPGMYWKRYQTQRITDEQWSAWREFRDDSNYALLMGARPWIPDNGFLAIDADSSKTLEIVKARLPYTPLKTETARGQHWIYRKPAHHVHNIIGIPVDGKAKVKDLDLKADGGYILAPGSKHASGCIYRMIEEWTSSSLLQAPVFDPAWLGLDLAQQPEATEIDLDHAEAVASHPCPCNERSKAAQEYLAVTPGAQQGRQADSYCLAIAIALLWDFLLPEDEAEDLLYRWGQREDNLDNTGGYYPWTHEQIRHKIADALRKPKVKLGTRLRGDWAYRAGEQVCERIKAVEPPEQVKPVEPKTRRLCRLSELFKLTDCDFSWLIQDRLPKGKLHVVAGKSKDGKSTALYQTAIDALLLGKALGKPADPKLTVLALDYEMDTGTVKSHILEPVLRTDEDWQRIDSRLHISNKQVQEPELALPPYVTADYLADMSRAYDGNLWIIIDSLRRAFGRQKLPPAWENDAATINMLLEPILQWCHLSGNTVSIIHHMNHGGRASGSTDIIGVADCLWDFVRERDAMGKRTSKATISPSGRGLAESTWNLEMLDRRYVWRGEGEQNKERQKYELASKVVDLLKEEELSGRSIFQKLGSKDKEKTYDLLEDLRRHYVIETNGKKGHALLLRLTDGWSQHFHEYGISLKCL